MKSYWRIYIGYIIKENRQKMKIDKLSLQEINKSQN
jgi:hypothetical protein